MLQKEKEYWLEKLSGEISVTEFPLDFKRRGHAGDEKGTAHFDIAEDTERRLRNLSGNKEGLIFAVLVAALKVCLHKYTGSEDILVGTTIHEHYARTSSLNTLLVLRDRVSGAMTVKELLLAVKTTLAEAYTHQKYPVGRILETLTRRSAEDKSPLINVLIILENINNREHIEGLAKDIALAFCAGESTITATLEYRAALFKRETIEAFIDHYKLVLHAVVSSPEAKIFNLPILTEAERHQLLFEWNKAFDESVIDTRIHERFEAQARRVPDAVALVFQDEQLSYDQLNRRANRLAHYLRINGSGPEVLVGICLERSVDMVVAMLGVLKSGAAYVPLDPAYPKARLELVIEDAQPLLVISRETLISKLPVGRARLIKIDTDWRQIASHSNDNPETIGSPGNLAYVIYTSGSTGRPKGVMIAHAEVVRLFDATGEWFGFGSEDVWTLFHSYAFDFSVWEVWGALLNGGKLLVVPYVVSRTPKEFYEMVRQNQVTVMNQTPSAFQQFIRSDEKAAAEAPSLRWIILGGEALDLGSLKEWYERHEDGRPQIVNMYGITETTVHVTYRPIKKEDVEQSKGSLIGRPIPDLRIYLLGAYGELAPAGAAAEIFVAGRGLSRGYLNRPGLTAERFLPDAFGGRPGERLYRTGDRARHLGGGEMEYLGRADQQVKIRGYRIEPGEIRAAITQQEGVKDAAIMVRADAQWGERLVAYVAMQEGANIADVNRGLKELLPEYMIPSAFVTVDMFPLTTNGKIDWKALPSPEANGLKSNAGYLAPRDTVELRLAHIWQEVLGIELVGVRDNFFDLGGHSILSVLLMERIKSALGIDLPIATLFRGTTVEDLAVQIRRQAGSAVTFSSLVEIQSGHSTLPFFCVHPAGGNVLCYMDLARELGPDQAFYGFQSSGLADGETLHLRIEDMAAHFVELLLEVQPTGPYFLGGWSIGGLIAFEMSQRLQARGKQVSLLALFDTVAPDPRRQSEDSGQAGLLRAFARNIGFSPEQLEISEDELDQLDCDGQLNRILGRAQAVGVLPLDASINRVRNLFKVFVTNVSAASRYSPATCSGRVTLFRAAGRMASGLPDHDGWNELADEVEAHIIPGDHFTMLRHPNVRILAQQLKGCIENATTKGATLSA
jgi:amino acid adenylation domain-containing protein